MAQRDSPRSAHPRSWTGFNPAGAIRFSSGGGSGDVNLAARFPGIVEKDARPGYGGWIVAPHALPQVARALRDEDGFDYLSSVTGVDDLPEDRLESVYHLYRSGGGPGLVLKSRTPREQARLPSLTAVFPGAEFQEREAWDLLGIRFDGHPDLRRILLWEGFEGHPLRKDWREPLYEAESKPFPSRWPAGRPPDSEESAPFVRPSTGRAPAGGESQDDRALYAALEKDGGGGGGGLETDLLTVNLGPQHPSTHGVFRIAALLDGENVVNLKPVMGYLHRCHEKIGERNTFLGNIPFTDRLDYLSSLSNNFGYVLAVEKLLGIRPPERADYLRVVLAELTRIVSHLWAIGFLLNDLGAFFTPALYAIEERELILDVFEAVTGSRMMCNFFRFGGLEADVGEDALRAVGGLVADRLPRRVDQLEAYLTGNEILRDRCIGVGVLPRERAVACSAAGPVLRASGVPYDVRKAEPYSVYDRMEWDVACRDGCDVYDRYRVRMDEIRQSMRILRQALRDLPRGAVVAGKPKYQFHVPPGEAYGRVEGPKGELGFYVASRGGSNPWRYHVRAPSFINLTALAEMCRGGKLADVAAVLGSIDIILGETDR
ncbi:MAG: NADH-quinone oxidoreductase subunit D [Anaerolineales bacterium]|nr:NADH-quinone oxidoreductase subunit D [Anaerolineales bacterium]